MTEVLPGYDGPVKDCPCCLGEGVVPDRPPSRTRRRTIQERFEEYDRANPEVYETFVRWLRELQAEGGNKIGMQLLTNRLRWEWRHGTVRTDEFRLNEQFASRYARKIATEHPDLGNMLEFRHLRSP